jgi:glycosyltransferase involved in cell wall biosynthesis
MKILMLLDSEFPPDVRVEKEARTLIASGHEVHILCYSFNLKQKKIEVYNSIVIHRFLFHIQLHKKFLGLIFNLPFYKFIWLFQTRRYIKKIKPEVLHIHDLPLCYIGYNIKKNQNNITFIADMHENYPYLVKSQKYMNTWFGRNFLSLDKWFHAEKKWLSYADHIITVASEMKNRLEKTLCKNNFSVIPNTIDINEHLSKQKDYPDIIKKYNDFFCVTYLGGIDPIRGIDILIKAAAIAVLSIPKLKVILVGNGTIVEDLKRLAKELKVESVIMFEGWQHPSTIKSYMEITKIGVLPYLKTPHTDNTSPNKLYEYMIYKIPIISSNCLSQESVILKENCGLIFEDRNIDDLAKKIIYLFNNPEISENLGKNGYKAVMEKYNWTITSKELLNLYTKIS